MMAKNILFQVFAESRPMLLRRRRDTVVFSEQVKNAVELELKDAVSSLKRDPTREFAAKTCAATHEAWSQFLPQFQEFSQRGRRRSHLVERFDGLLKEALSILSESGLAESDELVSRYYSNIERRYSLLKALVSDDQVAVRRLYDSVAETSGQMD